MTKELLKVCFYVPETHLEIVKDALFQVGAGKIGNYDRCCWQIEGQGQFRALDGSDAFIGELNEVMYLKEFKVEMMCDKKHIDEVVRILKETHPYETPAYDVTAVL